MSEKFNPFDIKDIIPKLNQIVSAVSTAVEIGTIEDILREIADFTRELINARFAAIAVPGETDEFLFYEISSAEDIKHLIESGSKPTGLGLLSTIMEEKRPLMIDPVHESGFPEGHLEMKHLMGVPIHIGMELLGILYLADREDGHPFEEDDLLITEIMAGYAALAITGANLSEHKERIALLEERERIAMELHDGIIQSLYGIGMQIEIARSDGVFDMNEVKDLIHSLDDVINEIRFYIKDLRTQNLKQKTVLEALSDLTSRLHIPDSIQVIIDAPNKRSSLSTQTIEGLSNITSEAVSNAIRHADAKNIHIKARELPEVFNLTISDDGTGFNLERTMKDNHGMGLNNIIYRVNSYQGKIHIESSEEGGTELRIEIPLA